MKVLQKRVDVLHSKVSRKCVLEPQKAKEPFKSAYVRGI